MSAPFDELVTGRRAWLARANLSELDATTGRPGRIALAHRPDLIAGVDQHIAAIRDALYGNANPIALAGYGVAVRDSAYAAGDALDDWTAPTWSMLRLLAVCEVFRTSQW